MFDLSKYNYELPKELIAQKPADPRDSSRLFIYNTENNEIIFDNFVNLDKYLPKNSFLVFNNTRVLPARVVLKKPTGGKVELLLFVNELTTGDVIIKGLSDRKIEVGQRLSFPGGEILEIVDQKEKFFFFKPEFDIKILSDLLFKYGVTPIPKYIGKTVLDEKELREKYQSVFAEKPASVAAPTASLHFTDRVLEKIKQKGIDSAFITLNVGLGTFSPLTEENLERKKLHEEYMEIGKETAERIRQSHIGGKKIIPVGTTAVRTIESASKEITDGVKEDIKRKTDIFIFPPYDFNLTDGIITNFHLPESSLMCLVDAFLDFKGAKRNITELYEIAKKEKFRFYSFGDAMLVI